VGSLFDQWVFHGGTPTLKASYSWDQTRKQAKIRLDQTQKVSEEVMLFHPDVPIRFITEKDKVVDVVAKLRSVGDDFYFELPAKAKIVRIDLEYTLLASIDFKPANPIVFAQFESGGDMMGRLLAAKLLGGRKDKASLEKLAQRLNEDAFYGVRIEAAKSLAKSGTPESFGHLLAFRDQDDARVRQKVIRGITGFYRPEARKALVEVIAEEKNPEIVSVPVAELGKFPADEVEEALITALWRESYRHAIAASVIQAFRKQGDPELLGPLINHVEKNEASFRTRDFGAALDTMAYLARDLEEQCRSEVRQFIANYTYSPKDQLRPAAIPVLESFTSQDEASPEYKAADAAIKSSMRTNGRRLRLRISGVRYWSSRSYCASSSQKWRRWRRRRLQPRLLSSPSLLDYSLPTSRYSLESRCHHLSRKGQCLRCHAS